MFDSLIIQYLNEPCSRLCILEKHKKEADWKTWLYGMSSVTLISMSSLAGVIFIPFAKKSFYKKLLMFLISLAVGSLTSIGLLHLIPNAHGIGENKNHEEHHIHDHDYLWKGVVILVGVYLFYSAERILRLILLKREIMCKKPQINITKNVDDLSEEHSYDVTRDKKINCTKIRLDLSDQKNPIESHGLTRGNNSENCCSTNNKPLEEVTPVAWLIIFGDSLHNFIDGLSIGAAYCESPFKGFSICIAVLCEEFPHELGDFAVLLNSGMSYKMALLFNFLSACSCYIGLTVGILVAEDEKISKWIYALAGGMFIYIALCDMIPELNESGEEIERDYLNELYEKHDFNVSNQKNKQIDFNSLRLIFKIKIFLLQNLGIAFGFFIMFIMCFFCDQIKI